MQRSAASQDDEWQVPAAAVIRLQNLTGCSQPITMTSRPKAMPDELAKFWGGYLVAFKLIGKNRAVALGEDTERMRREAIKLGEGSKFTIDISRHEYVDGKEEHDLQGYKIFVYTPEMIVCEKLRAICQQMPAYGDVILRNGPGKQRARDFIDIHALVQRFSVDLSTERAQNAVRQMFDLKRGKRPAKSY